MALDPPKAKNDAYWNNIDVVVISATVRWRKSIRWNSVVENRRRGMFVARDCVIARILYRL